MTNRRRGFSLLDVLLALGVSAAMYASVAQMQNDLTNNLRAQAAANSMVMLADAANIYIKSNYQSLKNYGSAFEVPITGNSSWNGIGDLTSTGMLPSSFANRFPGNQQAHLLVRQIPQNGNIPQHLEAMLVTAGGSPMNDRQVGLAMAKMGGNGGGVMQNPPPGVSTSNIQGSFASWSQPISQWSAAGVAPTYGHLAYDLSTVGSPVGEFLDRYDVGNPEANRMHTSIDFNNFNANNVNTIDGENNNDVRIGDSEHTGRVVMQNGGMACQGNATGCSFDISDDGGFYDQNDFWVTFQGSWSDKGLRIAGQGDNLQVYGQTIANNGVVTSDASGIQWTGSPEVGASVEAAATYSDGWLNVTGMDGFQGISTQIVQGTKFQDANDTDFYVVPSQVSHLNNANFAGQISTNGYDYQSDMANGLAGGVNTWDVYAHGQLAVGSDRQVDGFFMDQGNLVASQYVQGQVIRPNYTATIGQPCSGASINGSMGRQLSFGIQNGDIARDSDGFTLVCAKGIWNSTSAFTQLYWAGCGSHPSQNTTSKPWLVEYVGGMSYNNLQYHTVNVSGPLEGGGQASATINNRRDSDKQYSSTFILLPGSSFSTYQSFNDGASCYRIYY